MTKNNKRTADQVRRLLKERFPPPEWALLEEVRNVTGYGHRVRERYADAVAMNMWPSRGLSVLGFEVKVQRSDWVKELRDPAKSAAIQQYCDYWWVVAGDKDLVQPGELPETWGLLVVQGNEKLRLVCKKEAPKLEAKPLDRLFIASMLRRANEQLAAWQEGRVTTEEYEKGYERGLEQGKNSAKWDQRMLQQDYDVLRQRVEAFEKSSGMKIDGWDAGRFPEKASEEFLGLLENVSNNAEQQGFDAEDMEIVHVAPHKVGERPGRNPRAAGATEWNTTLADVELIIEEPEADD